MEQIRIRFAATQDAAALLAIYAPYVEATSISFECEVPALEEFTNRIERISSAYPYLVCEIEGKIVGYAYAHRHMERAAYQWNAELSIYTAQSLTRRGIGKALYASLIELLALQGVLTVYGGVTLPNPKSEKLHAHFGFKRLGTYRHTGYKLGKWHDVAWFEKDIGDHCAEPQPMTAISRVPLGEIAAILENNRLAIRQ